MIRYCFCAAVLVCSMVSLALAGDVAKDTQRMQGEWQVVALETRGEKKAGDEVKNFRLTIKGNEITIGDRKSKFQVDAGTSPKAIDVTPLDGPKKGETLKGIYSLDQGRLRICVSNEKILDTRPQQFKTQKDDGLVVLTLVPVKSK